MTDTITEPVGVLGIGVEGRTTLEYLTSIGVEQIVALDRHPVENLPDGVTSVIGERHTEDLARFGTIFRSPGIRPNHPALEAARKSGTRITSAVSFFLEQCPADVVGVTGTLGKGTTASLIAAMSEAAGFTTHLGGNIGRSPLSFLGDVAPEDKVVLEISSFQAMDVARSPRIAVVLKTTSEHLDWHIDQAEYVAAKAHLLAHQSMDGVVVFNGDAAAATRIAAAGGRRRLAYSTTPPVNPGIHIDNGLFRLFEEDSAVTLPIDVEAIRLPGIFNRENIAASILAARELGVPLTTACRVAETFEGLPHRLQYVGSAAGVRYYNDSYATRPDATIGAVASFTDTPLALILGGSEKHADFDELASVLASHPSLVHISLIGATADRLQKALAPRLQNARNMTLFERFDDAILAASRSLDRGGVVLLSPACASFGMFPNYKVRGEIFVETVKRIIHSVG